MSQEPMSPNITDDDKLWAMLSYLIPLIAIVVLFMEDKKARKFIKYHSVQALAFFVVYFILAAILSAITLGILAFIVGPLAFVLYIVFCIKAYQGQWFEIPWLTNFCKKQGWM